MQLPDQKRQERKDCWRKKRRSPQEESLRFPDKGDIFMNLTEELRTCDGGKAICTMTIANGPSFPERFEGIDDVRKWMEIIVDWYNNEHRHSGISYVSPAQRRRGEDIEILERRKKTYEAARIAHPERWSRDIRKWEHVKEVKLNSRSKKNRQGNAA